MTSQVEVSNLIKPLVDAYRFLNAEWNNFFDIGLNEYLQSQTEKYYFTNTFIHRSEKVRFNEIYYPIKASYKKLTTDFNNVEEVFDEYKNITIVGLAGSGKTTLLKYIFLKTIENHKRIPILIELRNLNDYNGDFEKLIADKILKSKVKPNDLTFKRTLESGNFLFLLDGYDEIFSAKKQEINRQIEMFVDAYSLNKFLITTRPGSGIESFSRFHDFKVCPLQDDDVKGFIAKIVDEGERKERIITIIEEPKNNNYIEYLRNPLLLSMFIMAFESHPEIPNRKSAFYRNVFDTLYSRHDGITKNSFPREKLTKLQRDDFENILSVFSYLSLIEGQYAFTHEYLSDTLSKVKSSGDYDFTVENLIYDLRTSISILILDGFEYYFPHRSMQEYFTALFIDKLPTDRKNKAYKNLTSVLQESSADYSFNFWSLCFEMDEPVFISNFLIPQLKKISKLLSNKDDKELLQAYFSLIRPVLIYTDFREGGKELRILRHASFQNSIIDFCQIYDYSDVWKFPKNAGCEKQLLDVYEKEQKEKKNPDSDISVDIEANEQVIDILLGCKFNDLIKQLKAKIDSKITQWDIDIQRKKNNIDELLKI